MFSLILVVFWFTIVEKGAAKSSVDEIKSIPWRICSDSDGRGILRQIEIFIKLGQLSNARELANECLLNTQNPEKASNTIIECCFTPSEIIDTYNLASEELFDGDDNFLSRIEEAIIQRIHWSNDKRVHADASYFAEDGMLMDLVDPFSRDCFFPESLSKSRGALAVEQWNEYCSFFGKNECKKMAREVGTFPNQLAGPPSFSYSKYCVIAPGSYNHLVLPALREPRVIISLEFQKFSFENGGWITEPERSEEMLDIEQEGSLRMYDVSGVLWPAGYLLGLCLSDPIKCGAPEVLDVIWSKRDNIGAPLAIELGAGVGFPSIALAKAMKHQGNFLSHAIVATDSSKASCSLVIENSYRNGVGKMINVTEANFLEGSISHIREKFFGNSVDGESRNGFNLIIGSSLQGLFHGTSETNAKLWKTLDALLSKSDPNSVVILSHVRYGDERIEVPEHKQIVSDGDSATFECIRRISGDIFDMKTRDDKSSDFEIILLRRRSNNNINR